MSKIIKGFTGHRFINRKLNQEGYGFIKDFIIMTDGNILRNNTDFECVGCNNYDESFIPLLNAKCYHSIVKKYKESKIISKPKKRKINNSSNKRPKKIKRKTIPQPLRRQVWETYNGYKYNVKCYCCKHNNINPFQFECGHVVADAKGGSINVNNLRPICSSCNKSMGTNNLYDFKKTFF